MGVVLLHHPPGCDQHPWTSSTSRPTISLFPRTSANRGRVVDPHKPYPNVLPQLSAGTVHSAI